MSSEDTLRILAAAEETLETARLGLEDFKGKDPRRKLAGLRNFVAFGRAVTHVLQQLRSTEGSRFETWYGPYVKEMANDELMRFFKELRNEVLKEGSMPVSTQMHIRNFTVDFNAIGPPPKGAKSFIADMNGRGYWNVELEDGTSERYYVNLPMEVDSFDAFFVAPPRSHLGRPIEGLSGEHLATLYFEYLRAMVASARGKFG
jgi:hypothetical protein